MRYLRPDLLVPRRMVRRAAGSAACLAFWLLLGSIGAACAVLISSECAAALARTMRTMPDGSCENCGSWRWGGPICSSAPGAGSGSCRSPCCSGWRTCFRSGFSPCAFAHVPFTVCASLSAIALMAGQLPLTFAGLGARDVALVVLLSYMAPESAAAMGVLISTRGLLPPLIGIPLMRPYLASAVEEARRWRQNAATAS